MGLPRSEVEADLTSSKSTVAQAKHFKEKLTFRSIVSSIFTQTASSKYLDSDTKWEEFLSLAVSSSWLDSYLSTLDVSTLLYGFKDARVKSFDPNLFNFRYNKSTLYKKGKKTQVLMKMPISHQLIFRLVSSIQALVAVVYSSLDQSHQQRNQDDKTKVIGATAKDSRAEKKLLHAFEITGVLFEDLVSRPFVDFSSDILGLIADYDHIETVLSTLYQSLLTVLRSNAESANQLYGQYLAVGILASVVSCCEDLNQNFLIQELCSQPSPLLIESLIPCFESVTKIQRQAVKLVGLMLSFRKHEEESDFIKQLQDNKVCSVSEVHAILYGLEIILTKSVSDLSQAVQLGGAGSGAYDALGMESLARVTSAALTVTASSMYNVFSSVSGMIVSLPLEEPTSQEKTELNADQRNNETVASSDREAIPFLHLEHVLRRSHSFPMLLYSEQDANHSTSDARANDSRELAADKWLEARSCLLFIYEMFCCQLQKKFLGELLLHEVPPWTVTRLDSKGSATTSSFGHGALPSFASFSNTLPSSASSPSAGQRSKKPVPVACPRLVLNIISLCSLFLTAGFTSCDQTRNNDALVLTSLNILRSLVENAKACALFYTCKLENVADFKSFNVFVAEVTTKTIEPASATQTQDAAAQTTRLVKGSVSVQMAPAYMSSIKHATKEEGTGLFGFLSSSGFSFGPMERLQSLSPLSNMAHSQKHKDGSSASHEAIINSKGELTFTLASTLFWLVGKLLEGYLLEMELLSGDAKEDRERAVFIIKYIVPTAVGIILRLLVFEVTYLKQPEASKTGVNWPFLWQVLASLFSLFFSNAVMKVKEVQAATQVEMDEAVKVLLHVLNLSTVLRDPELLCHFYMAIVLNEELLQQVEAYLRERATLENKMKLVLKYEFSAIKAIMNHFTVAVAAVKAKSLPSRQMILQTIKDNAAGLRLYDVYTLNNGYADYVEDKLVLLNMSAFVRQLCTDLRHHGKFHTLVRK